MAGKNYKFKEQAKEMAEEAEKRPTIENAHTLSLFHLRQELTRRGIFEEVFGNEGEKRRINYENCLEVLMAELVKEEQARQEQHAQEIEKQKASSVEGETLAERLAREKEERKRAALERSAKRQAEREYFAQKKKINEDHTQANTSDK